MRAVSLLLLVAAAIFAGSGVSARDEWTIVETARFRIHGRADADWMTRRAAQLERFDHLLRLKTGVSAEPLPPRMNVFLADRQKDIMRLSGDAIGFYVASPDGVCAFSPRRGGDTAEQILQHEYAHHFMLQHFPTAYPEWYIEGFAEYFMTAELGTDTAQVGRYSPGRVRWLAAREWLPLEKILRGQVETGDENAMFYAQSWLMTHYFYSSPERTPQLSEYLAAFASGQDPVAAFNTVLGESLEAFEGRLRGYFDEGRISYRRHEFAEDLYQGGAVNITELPASSDDIMLPFFAISCSVGEAAEQLGDLRKEAAREDGDAFAARIRAFAEAEAGETALAIDTLTPLADAGTQDADLFYYLGRAYSRRAHEEGQDVHTNHAAARRYYAKAFQLRPDHFQTLYYYVHDSDTPYTGENERNLLVRARELAPQVAEVNISLAIALAAQGDFADAETVLSPVVNNPHLRMASEPLAELMQRIRERDVTIGGDVQGTAAPEAHSSEESVGSAAPLPPK